MKPEFYYCNICGTQHNMLEVIHIRRNKVDLKVCKVCSQGEEIIGKANPMAITGKYG